MTRMQSTDCELISFDLDGTLVDTAGEIAEAANRTLEIFGRPRHSVVEISHLIGFGIRELMVKLWERASVENPAGARSFRTDDILDCVEAEYAALAGTQSVAYQGCYELLTDLKDAGLPVACVTNKEIRHARRVLGAVKLEQCFDLIIGGDSLNKKKPDGSVLRYVAHSLGANIELTAHLGDSRIDVLSARNSGARAWAVSYGYNGNTPISESLPDRLFGSLSEVRAFLFR